MIFAKFYDKTITWLQLKFELLPKIRPKPNKNQWNLQTKKTTRTSGRYPSNKVYYVGKLGGPILAHIFGSCFTKNYFLH